MSKYRRLGSRGEVWEVIVKWPTGQSTHTLFSTLEDANLYACNRAAEIALRGWKAAAVTVKDPWGKVASQVQAGIGHQTLVG